jgi:hypothetical protein
MMPIGNLAKMVVGNTLRSRRHFILSAFGIVIGISTFVLFLASTEQVATVLEKIFPLDQVQVVAPRASLLGKDISKKLDDAIVKRILGRKEVASALPRMNLSFPAFGRGDFEGNDLKFEVGGFADGIDPGFVDDDERIRALFKDWDADKSDPHRIACVPPPRNAEEEVIQSPQSPPSGKPPAGPSGGWDSSSGSAASAPSGSAAASGSATGSATATGSGTATATGSGTATGTGSGTGSGSGAAMAIGSGSGSGSATVISTTGDKAPKYFNPCPQPDRYYCDDFDHTCHHRVPVVMSPTMIELYNGQFAKSHGLPIADTDFIRFVTQRGGLSAMRFSIGLGLTTIAGSNTSIRHKPRRVEGVLVGISNKAMPIGMTMPIQYIQKWNREYLGEEAATAYSSIIVTLSDRNQLAPFGQWLQDDLDLRLEDSIGEKLATVLFVIRLVLVLISLVIIGISAINIAHNFFMQVTERRRELGLLRAVGATQGDVRMVVIGEAALIGLIGGILGVLLGVAMAAGVDYGSAHYLPRFPYKPTTWFHFSWWIWTGGLVCAAGFAVFGGYLPARKASLMEPAQALTQN